MDNKELFKTFVKKNSRLINFVKNGDMTWQKFYEIYDLYGESTEAWNRYLTPEKIATAAATAGVFGLTDIFNWLKNIDLDSFQSGVGNIQKAIGVVQDLTNKKGDATTTSTKETYRPRPLYRHFED